LNPLVRAGAARGASKISNKHFNKSTLSAEGGEARFAGLSFLFEETTCNIFKLNKQFMECNHFKKIV
jgi:hypothetical protein